MRLICFGDSWTAGNGIEEEEKYGSQLLKIANGFYEKLRIHNCWPRWLANKMECLYVTFAMEGRSNPEILQDIETVLKDNVIKSDDLLIVMLTYPYRRDDDPIKTFEKIENKLKPYNHFYFNAFHPMFKECTYENIPDCFIEPNHSMMDLLLDYELNNPETEPLWEFGKKRHWCEERNKFEGGGHPNLKGYKLIADYIFDKIKNVDLKSVDTIKNNKLL